MLISYASVAFFDGENELRVDELATETSLLDAKEEALCNMLSLLSEGKSVSHVIIKDARGEKVTELRKDVYQSLEYLKLLKDDGLNAWDVSALGDIP